VAYSVQLTPLEVPKGDTNDADRVVCRAILNLEVASPEGEPAQDRRVGVFVAV